MARRRVVMLRGVPPAVVLAAVFLLPAGCRGFRPPSMEFREAGEGDEVLGVGVLRKKQNLEIEGRFAGGRFEANRIKIKDPDKEVELKGPLDSLDVGRGRGSIGGVAFRVPEGARWAGRSNEPVGPQAFAPGDWVKGELVFRRGRLLLRKLRLRDRREGEWEQIQGTAQEIERAAGRLSIGGVRVEFPLDVLVVWHAKGPPPRWRGGGRRQQVFIRGTTGLRKIHRIDPDERRPEEQLTIGNVATLGGELRFDLEWRGNHDLNQNRERDRLIPRISSSLEVSLDLSDRVFAFVKGRTIRSFVGFDQEKNLNFDWQYRLVEAFVFLADVPLPGIALQLGRQDFDQGREWLMDENLDAARAYFNLDFATMELSASTVTQGASPRLEGVKNFLWGLHSEPLENQEIFAYALHRKGGTQIDLDRTHVGLSLEGEAGDFEYWGDFAYMFGKTDGQDVRGYGADVAAMYVLADLPLEPSLFGGIAHGSGDSDPGRGTDGNFRQSGFQDNNDGFNGVTSFRYLGELVRPELSNLQVLTAGFGLRPARRTSLDLVYHRYLQVETANFLTNTRLRKSPNGRSPHLGHEIDMILGLEYLRPVESELVFAYFNPTGAFDDESPAWFLTFQLKYTF